jgi:UDP-3-O-[3-hydroxymyristoyl] N-acetylglucosamine deacetylase/3-hydroxyacyl-[acyl-carrier-protein] dehydratase
MVKQTIKTEISLTELGHTGKEVKMTFKPAPINNGFCQSRPRGTAVVEADANFVNTQRGTNLENLSKIQTPEHVFWH